MLTAAPALRQSYDEYIQKSIFINADLSPAAAKLAYESRKKRSENQTQRPVRAIDANHMDTGNAMWRLTSGPAMLKNRLTTNVATSSRQAALGPHRRVQLYRYCDFFFVFRFFNKATAHTC